MVLLPLVLWLPGERAGGRAIRQWLCGWGTLGWGLGRLMLGLARWAWPQALGEAESQAGRSQLLRLQQPS